MNPVRYVLRVQAKNVRVEARVNDVPVAMYAPGQAEQGAEVPLNEFLVTGNNAVTLIVNANPLPSRVFDAWSPQAETRASVGQPAQAKATVVRQENGKDWAAFTPVQLAWSGLCQPVPARVDRSFAVDIHLPPWAWLRARPLQGADAAAAVQALRALHARLAQRDAAGVAAIMALKLQEITEAAYGVPAEPLRNGFLAGLGRCMADPTWTLLPVNAGDVDLRVVGGQRMAECLRPDGRHALTYVKQGSAATFFIPAMLGQVDGRWQVLR